MLPSCDGDKLEREIMAEEENGLWRMECLRGRLYADRLASKATNKNAYKLEREIMAEEENGLWRMECLRERLYADRLASKATNKNAYLIEKDKGKAIAIEVDTDWKCKTVYKRRRDLDSSRKKGKAIVMPFVPASCPPDLQRTSRTRYEANIARGVVGLHVVGVGPTLWEIGVPDHFAKGFYVPDPNPNYINKLYVDHPDRFRQYGLWERYAELYLDGDLVFKIGINEYHRLVLRKGAQRIEDVQMIKSGYNPAAWMLEVTSSSEESRLGVDFAKVYRRSHLF
ncbi:hypothetical protein GIB67_005590, partial [Kingdonia uniflora]